MKNIFLFIFIIIILSCIIPLAAQDSSATSAVNSFKRLYIAQIEIGGGIDTTDFHEEKVKSAINFIAMLLDEYILISDDEIASVVAKLPEQSTAFDVAKAVDSDEILLIKIEQIKNILRAEISKISTKTPDKVAVGDGFSFIRYFHKDSNKPLYDPSLLECLQRAFAVVNNDSLIFINKTPDDLEPKSKAKKNSKDLAKQQNNPYNIKPVPLLVIAGVEFERDSTFSNWAGFDNDLLRSYEVAETVFEIVKDSKDWVVFDIASRDEIYSLYKIYGIENNLPITKNEISALQRFNISYYISGVLRGSKKNVEISLYLNKIDGNKIEKIAEVNEKVTKNDIKTILEVIKKMAKKLLKMQYY